VAGRAALGSISKQADRTSGPEIRRPKPDPLRSRDSAARRNPKSEIRMEFQIRMLALSWALGFSVLQVEILVKQGLLRIQIKK
jgi:hypothetical protein